MYKIPLSRPSITTAEGQAAYDTVMSYQLAQGAKVEEFEQRIAEYVGTKYTIAVSSGTDGLFLCLKACGIGQGDEVITTPYTFIATLFAIEQAGARPVLVDIDGDTYNINLATMYRNTLDGIKAYMPVDVFGNPYDTSNNNTALPIIIDSCESLGSRIDRPFDACVYAFYPNKQITTGEGGMICTNNKDIADYCRAYRNQGRAPGDKWLQHSQKGGNYRMTDIQAAIGVEQMRRIDEIKQKRQLVALTYHEMLSDLYISKIINWQEFTSHDINPFAFVIEVPNRDKVMQYLIDKGIECKPYFPCVHLQPAMAHLGYKSGDFPIAEEVSSRTLALPFYTDMTEEEVNYVCEKLQEALNDGYY